MSILHELPDAPQAGPEERALIERIALALSSTLELNAVLRLLAEIGLDAGAAEYTAVFVLDGDEMLPAAAVARPADDGLLREFRAMPPIKVDGERHRLMAAGRAVALADARQGSLVPDAWIEVFQVRGLVLVPLQVGGEACGLLAAGWSHVRTSTSSDLRLFEAIAAYAGVAVRNARLYDTMRRRARLQQALALSAADLARPLEPAIIADRLASAYTDLLRARLCAIALFDEERNRITTIASVGTSPLPDSMPLEDVPSHLVDHLWSEWAKAKRPVEWPSDPWLDSYVGGGAAGVGRYVFLPLVVGGHSRGVVVLGFAAGNRLDTEERSAAEALADIAAAALDRHDLLGRLDAKVAELDVLYRTSAALADGADAHVLIDAINGLLAGHGIEVVDLRCRDRALARYLGAAPPAPEERAALGPAAGSVALPDGSLAVPMRLGRRVVGTLRVLPASLGPGSVAFLETLAGALADAANRSALRARSAEIAHGRAIGEERARIAADLHDTAGQLFVGIQMVARQRLDAIETGSAEGAVLDRFVELAQRGRWGIDQAIRALAFVPAARRGLAPSVRALAAALSDDSGIPVEVVVRGRPARLAPTVERALYRVASEALTNSWRHGSPQHITTELAFSSAEVRLRVLDDGTGLAEPEPATGSHHGICNMRRAVEQVGGSFAIGPGPREGVLVEAAVPRSRR